MERARCRKVVAFTEALEASFFPLLLVTGRDASAVFLYARATKAGFRRGGGALFCRILALLMLIL